MIKVSRLKGREFVLNAERIKYVEATPDTIITLTDNERIMVAESVDEIIRRVLEYRRLSRLLPDD